MGKKTAPKKTAAPIKRAAKTAPAAAKAALPEPPPPSTPAAPKAKKPEVSKPAKAAGRVKPTTKKVTKKAAKAKPAYTHDDVSLRAYFIAERRQKAGLPGDTHLDWVAAERELAAESKAAKSTKTSKPKAS